MGKGGILNPFFSQFSLSQPFFDLRLKPSCLDFERNFSPAGKIDQIPNQSAVKMFRIRMQFLHLLTIQKIPFLVSQKLTPLPKQIIRVVRRGMLSLQHLEASSTLLACQRHQLLLTREMRQAASIQEREGR